MATPIPPIFMPGPGMPDRGQSYDLLAGLNAIALSVGENTYNVGQLGGLMDVLHLLAIYLGGQFVSSFTDACQTFEELKNA